MVIARDERIANEGHIGIRETEHWITLIRFRFNRLALRFFGKSVRGTLFVCFNTGLNFGFIIALRRWGLRFFLQIIRVCKPWGLCLSTNEP